MPDNPKPQATQAVATVPNYTSEQFLALSPAKQQEYLSAKLFGTATEMEVNYTEYGKKCAINAIIATQSYLKGANKSFKDVDVDTYLLTLHAIALTELNCAANPAEAYIELRGNILAVRAQGAGNERLVRRFGVGIKPKTGLHNAWLVREGDEFTMPQFNGLEISAPCWKPNPANISKKVILVVYPVEKADGTVEYLIADRNSVKANVVAQIRQTLLYAYFKKNPDGTFAQDRWGHKIVDVKARDDAYAKINQIAEQSATLDEFLDNPDIAKVLNPTYVSYGSREAMVIRKMKNNALKQYPKDYDTSAVSEAMKLIDEDFDDTIDEPPALLNKPKQEDVIQQVERETKQAPTGPAVADFDVDASTGEVIAAKPAKAPEKPAEPAPKPAQKPADKPTTGGTGDYGDLW